MTDFRPKVILRTSVGAIKPLNPGLQHTQDHTEAFRHMLKSIRVVDIDAPYHIIKQYQVALAAPESFLMVEHGRLYMDTQPDA